MDDYVRYLIIVGAIVLVITLILFYIMFSYSKASNTWPPEEMPCPDYWKTSYDGNKDSVACEDIYHLTSRDDNNESITTYVSGSDVSLNRWYLDGPATSVGGLGSAGFVRGDMTDLSYVTGSYLWQTHCGKKIWAQHNGVSWDGITNSNIHCTETGYLANPTNIYEADTV